MRQSIATITAILFLAVLPAGPAAQDGGQSFEGGFADDSGESTDNSEGFGDGFGEDFGSFGGSAAADDLLSWSGRLRFDLRGTADYDRPPDSAMEAGADAQLELDYSADNSQALLRLEVDEGLNPTEDEQAAGDELLRKLMDEAYLQLYYDRFNLQAGYIKPVWGQGDQIHVVDFLGSNDLTDFINPDYIDRRFAAGMVKLNFPWHTAAGSSGRVELAYLPVLRPDYLPEKGPWAPEEAVILESLLTSYGNALAATRQADSGITPPTGSTIAPETALWAGLTAQEAVTGEDTQRLSYSQVATRATARLRGVDLGASYYFGYLKTPTPRIRLAGQEAFDAFVAGVPGAAPAPDPAGTVTLEYHRLHGFGLEGATVVGPLNLRAEAAYYLTEDIDGDDPEVPNNSLEYLAGFDVDLGISSLNLNVQALGSTILNSDAIDDAGPIADVSAEYAAAAAGDPSLPTGGLGVLSYDPNARLNYQYDEDGIYTSHTIFAQLSDSWRNDRIRPELTVAMGVERQDWRLAPAVEFVLRDDTLFEVSSAVYGGDDAGILGQFDDNDYVQLRFEYRF